MLVLFLKHCPKHLIISEKEAVYLIAYAFWLVGWLVLATFLKVKKFTLLPECTVLSECINHFAYFSETAS